MYKYEQDNGTLFVIIKSFQNEANKLFSQKLAVAYLKFVKGAMPSFGLLNGGMAQFLEIKHVKSKNKISANGRVAMAQCSLKKRH